MSAPPIVESEDDDYTADKDLHGPMTAFIRRYPQIRSTEKFGVHDELWKVLVRITNGLHSAVKAK